MGQRPIYIKLTMSARESKVPGTFQVPGTWVWLLSIVEIAR
jgi:hypothetical protein